VLRTLVLGIVQGLTEFLPISSSAHLSIVPKLLGYKTPELAFDVLLHFGTLAAVVVYFAKDLWSFVLSLLARMPEEGDHVVRVLEPLFARLDAERRALLDRTLADLKG